MTCYYFKIDYANSEGNGNERALGTEIVASEENVDEEGPEFVEAVIDPEHVEEVNASPPGADNEIMEGDGKTHYQSLVNMVNEIGLHEITDVLYEISIHCITLLNRIYSEDQAREEEVVQLPMKAVSEAQANTGAGVCRIPS